MHACLIGQYIPRILQLALTRLSGFSDFKTKSYRLHAIQLVLTCVLYNPTIAFAHLDSQSATSAFIQQLFIDQIHLDLFKRVYDKKLAILVICKIFMLRGNMPASVSGLVNPLFAGSIALFAKFPAAVEERKKSITMQFEDEELDDENTEVSDDEDDFQDLDDEEEVDPEKEEKYIKMLQKHAAERAASGNEEDDDWDEDEDEWGVPPIEEDPYFFTGLLLLLIMVVLDKVDPYGVFNGVMTQILDSPNDLVAGLSGEQIGVLQTVRTTVMVPFDVKTGKVESNGAGH